MGSLPCMPPARPLMSARSARRGGGTDPAQGGEIVLLRRHPASAIASYLGLVAALISARRCCSASPAAGRARDERAPHPFASARGIAAPVLAAQSALAALAAPDPIPARCRRTGGILPRRGRARRGASARRPGPRRLGAPGGAPARGDLRQRPLQCQPGAAATRPGPGRCSADATGAHRHGRQPGRVPEGRRRSDDRAAAAPHPPARRTGARGPARGRATSSSCSTCSAGRSPVKPSSTPPRSTSSAVPAATNSSRSSVKGYAGRGREGGHPGAIAPSRLCRY